jgi:endonuclease/exonuclease/phosphatase family metal-dependent hydrolase
MDVRVMTFNLRTLLMKKDGVNYWPHRVEKAAAVIRANDPLLVGTQEGFASMLEEMTAHLPGYAWFGWGRDEDQGGETCSILYKSGELDLVESGRFWLSELPDVPGSKSWDSALPRTCAWGKFRSRREPEKQLVMFNTHLDRRGEQARDQGIRLIWQKMQSMREPGCPMLLSGDFNSYPQSDVVQFMRGQLALDGLSSDMVDVYSVLPDSPVSPGLTSHGFEGGEEGEPIDYIFVTPEVRVRQVTVDRRKVDGGYPSDHYPVVADLVL